ncbi:hypothetical protein ADK55_15760 [Streptomyces sp. WM4235]|nr:hypothetical protein ADK55_15760 [Streptomyces sp. WM4235]
MAPSPIDHTRTQTIAATVTAPADADQVRDGPGPGPHPHPHPDQPRALRAGHDPDVRTFEQQPFDRLVDEDLDVDAAAGGPDADQRIPPRTSPEPLGHVTRYSDPPPTPGFQPARAPVSKPAGRPPAGPVVSFQQPSPPR